MNEKVYVIRNWWYDGEIEIICRDKEEARKRCKKIIEDYCNRYSYEEEEKKDFLKQFKEEDYADEIVSIEEHWIY